MPSNDLPYAIQYSIQNAISHTVPNAIQYPILYSPFCTSSIMPSNDPNSVRYATRYTKYRTSHSLLVRHPVDPVDLPTCIYVVSYVINDMFYATPSRERTRTQYITPFRFPAPASLLRATMRPQYFIVSRDEGAVRAPSSLGRHPRNHPPPQSSPFRPATSTASTATIATAPSEPLPHPHPPPPPPPHPPPPYKDPRGFLTPPPPPHFGAIPSFGR